MLSVEQKAEALRSDSGLYEDVSYQRPFLKEVIARIDFAAPIDSLGKSVPSRVANAVLKRFPISEPRQTLAQELQVSSKEIRHRREEFTEWNYYGRDREKRLAVSPSFALVTYSRYNRYEQLKDDFLAALEELMKAYPDLRAARLGLRYINSIDPEGQDPLVWDSLVDPGLLGLFSRFRANGQELARVLHILEFKYDDVQVKFQFGAPNPDFPARIKRPLFVLDFDSYVQGLQELRDIDANIDRAHERVQALFETSITDELRRMMRAH